MKQRVITAIIALLIFIPLAVIGGTAFDFLVIILGLIGLSEILVMRKKLLVSPEAILSGLAAVVLLVPQNWLAFLPSVATRFTIFYFFVLILLLYTVMTRNRFSFDDVGVLVLGALFVSLGFHYLMAARQAGIDTLFFLLFIVWTTDSGAYMIGRKFGKHKLSPHISPNKTWEGSIGGTVAALIVGLVFNYFWPQAGNWIESCGIIILLSIIGQAGDLVESALKRFYGVKDSGRILPGHGGILDRFDSLLFVLPFAHFIGLI
ncbi:MAG: phosphatidate cytidylyltransferase [Liquorilactobacillus ghanensis]|jgi:phosphatidate cytidylyltransferase|uniref:Phosphatidate cytidylyltransferase n=1 Tax=Liquorilactobacillus ghanensis DSM 18630 TaxID=1423750 RepID=A0A0R1VSD4_9LACO|nr:phosphatidate cytidylyltransferase [Liquorilactobacillus ghanensis]KRM08333.1 CDP-diglyceride synthetase [Liquorilactobacillus ghanensis DSM 18630]